jgi:hypothetical protein
MLPKPFKACPSSTHENFSLLQGMMLPPILVLLFFIAESLLFTVFRGRLGFFYSPIAFLVLGLSLGLIPLLFPAQWHRPGKKGIFMTRTHALIIWVIGVILSGGMMMYIVESYPLNPKYSDIIPTLDSIYLDRFLAAEPVYTEGKCGDLPCTPNYLPMQWLPFVISAVIGFDHRWTALFFLWIAIGLLVHLLRKSGLSGWNVLLRAFLPFILLFAWMKWNPDTFGHTIETLITAWYLMLGIGFSYTQPWIRGGGLILTLLSRYTLAFWMPLYILLYKKLSEDKFRKTAFFTLAGVLLLYVFPFLISEPLSFWKGFESYPIAAMGEWKGQAWQAAGDPPFQLFQGFGFASWVYTYAQGSLEDKFMLARILNLAGALFGTLLAGIAVYKLGKNVPEDLKLLVSFKIYLTFFFAFLLVPYTYLHLVPSFFSLLIVLRYYYTAGERQSPKV